jgi:hypothetical protein
LTGVSRAATNGVAVSRALPWATLAFWAAVAIYALIIGTQFAHRGWDADEFEHLQCAWLISDGLVPYRDFFEHHTPLFALVGATVFHFVPATTPDHIATILLLFRGFSVACSVVIVYLTWRLARLIGGLELGCLAVALLLSESFFILKGVEIRPDTLATLLVMVAINAAWNAFLRPAPSRATTVWAAIAGLTCALAVGTTQKAIFFLPGFAIAFVGSSLRRHGVKQTAIYAAYSSIAALAGFFLVCAYFIREGALFDLIKLNFLQNAAWPRDGHWRIYWAKVAFEHDTLFVLLCGAGTALILWRWWRRGETMLVWLILAPLSALGLGLLALPIVQPQYFFMALPLAAIAGAIAVNAAVLAFPAWKRPILVVFAAATLIFVGINLVRGLTTPFGSPQSRDDTIVRAKLAYIVTQLPRDATIMNSWSSGVAFRRPAWFYYFLHPEIQQIIPKTRYAALEAGLRNGTINPAVVDLDRFTLQMPSSIVAWIKQNYEPAGLGTLQRRRTESRPRQPG